MIWEQKIKNIVMVTNCTEAGRVSLCDFINRFYRNSCLVELTFVLVKVFYTKWTGLCFWVLIKMAAVHCQLYASLDNIFRNEHTILIYDKIKYRKRIVATFLLRFYGFSLLGQVWALLAWRAEAVVPLWRTVDHFNIRKNWVQLDTKGV